MGLPLPGSLTPSKVATFKDCALAFRLSVIDRLPEPPSLQAFKGTVVHRALELLMWEEPQGARSPAVALKKLDRAFAELSAGREGVALGLEGDEREEFIEDARQLVRNYFVLEDPDSVQVIGTELLMQADIGFRPGRPVDHAPFSDEASTQAFLGAAEQAPPGVPGPGVPGPGAPGALGGEGLAAAPRAPGAPPPVLRLRGIIDRLELDSHGELVVTDYKTGRAPGDAQVQARLGGVHFYAFLCDRVLGKRPVRVQLFHLREPLAIGTAPSDQSIAGLQLQANAIWDAIRRACSLEDFRPKPGVLCERCAFRAYCPAVGGDIALVRAAREGQVPEDLRLPLPDEVSVPDAVSAVGQSGMPATVEPQPTHLPLAASW